MNLNPLSWIGGILSPVADAFKSWNDGRVRIKEAKINAKVAQFNSQARLAEKQVDAETNWDLEALRASETSWKDEWLTLLLSLPFLGSFIPHVQDYVVKGWDYVARAPLWYQTAFLGVVAASFGLRWWFNRSKMGAAVAAVGGAK